MPKKVDTVEEVEERPTTAVLMSLNGLSYVFLLGAVAAACCMDSLCSQIQH